MGYGLQEAQVSRTWEIETGLNSKEEYLVTAHAPNFDFWTGCREIKRCEESKGTLKNPFVSRLAEFSGLQINDILFPLSFDLGKIGTFGINFIDVDRRTKRWKTL